MHVEVAPGAPQERSSAVVDMDGAETGELRSRCDFYLCLILYL